MRRHATGQAVVSLSCAASGKRRDFYLGVFGTDAALAKYSRTISTYLDAGRDLGRMKDVIPARGGGILCADLGYEYWERRLRGNYSKTHRLTLRSILQNFLSTAGDLSVVDVGPRLVTQWRDSQVRERGWSRSYANTAVQRVRAMFRWGVGQEMVPASVLAALDAIEPLRAGQRGVRETRPVPPVSWAAVDAVLPYLAPPLRAIVEVQRATGARAGEIVTMRPADIDRTGEVWLYRPADHKNAHRSKARVIPLGPRAQAVITPFLLRPDSAFMFSPKEVVAQIRAERTAARTTPQSCGNRAGTNRVSLPKNPPGDHYTTDSYRSAIWSACDRAFPPPLCLSPAAIRLWQKDHRWNPHQIRHAVADDLARQFDVVTASKVLGHSDARITATVYTTRDTAEVAKVAMQVG